MPHWYTWLCLMRSHWFSSLYQIAQVPTVRKAFQYKHTTYVCCLRVGLYTLSMYVYTVCMYVCTYVCIYIHNIVCTVYRYLSMYIRT